MNYDELLAPAAKFMRPSGIRKFFDLAAEMPHCISLGVGEPDFDTPWPIREEAIRAIKAFVRERFEAKLFDKVNSDLRAARRNLPLLGPPHGAELPAQRGACYRGRQRGH